MGTYTRFVLKCNLRKDTPKEVVELLERVIVKGDLGVEHILFHSDEVFVPELLHDFFKCERWYMLLISNDFGSTKGSSFELLPNGYYSISIDTQFKNYDDEVDKFIDWITPYVAGRKKKHYVGYWKVEGCEYDINIYINHQKLLTNNPL